MGYPNDLLSTRAVVKPGLWAVIPKDGLVNNVIPYIKNCDVSIVASPKMGASFVQYVVNAQKGGQTVAPFAAENGLESFIYIIEGTVKIKIGKYEGTFNDGGYAFSPADTGLEFSVVSEKAKFLLYKQKYIPYEKLFPHIVTGNITEIPFRNYNGIENVLIKDFLPTDNPAFDMNMHILSFMPGGCHPFVETHIQEHGAYILNGKGMYYMDNKWLGIEKDDFMWFGPYCPQCAYGVGTEPFEYIYSKDCNRDAML